YSFLIFFFFSSRRRHTRFDCDWSSDVCSSDLQRERQAGTVESRLRPLGLLLAILGAPLGLPYGWLVTTHAAQSATPANGLPDERSEERRVGKECRARW